VLQPPATAQYIMISGGHAVVSALLMRSNEAVHVILAGMCFMLQPHADIWLNIPYMWFIPSIFLTFIDTCDGVSIVQECRERMACCSLQSLSD